MGFLIPYIAFVAISNEKEEGHCLRFRVYGIQSKSESLADYSDPENFVANHSVSGSPQIVTQFSMFS